LTLVLRLHGAAVVAELPPREVFFLVVLRSFSLSSPFRFCSFASRLRSLALFFFLLPPFLFSHSYYLLFSCPSSLLIYGLTTTVCVCLFVYAAGRHAGMGGVGAALHHGAAHCAQVGEVCGEGRRSCAGPFARPLPGKPRPLFPVVYNPVGR
jgi:hypothetical protein